MYVGIETTVFFLGFIQGFRSFSLHNREYGGRFCQIKDTVVIRLFYNHIFELSPTGLSFNLCE